MRSVELDPSHSASTRGFRFRRSNGLVLVGLILFNAPEQLGCGRGHGRLNATPDPAQAVGRPSGITPSSNQTSAGSAESIATETARIVQAGDARPLEEPASLATRPATTIPTRELVLAPGKRSVRGQRGMVVSVNAEATRIGVELLKAHGNAVDAAVGVAFALAVTHPSAGNLGGGGFALVGVPGGPTLALDFRESSPAGLDRQRFNAMIRAGGEGPDSVGIPGSVAGLFELSTRLGRLPFAQVIEPARRLAAQGHRIEQREATAIRVAWKRLRQIPLARAIYGRSDQRPRARGDQLTLPQLAATLSRLQAEGRDGFYRGPVATSIVMSLGPDPQIQETDLEGYRAVWRQPLVLPYRGVRVSIMPPPSAGGIALAASLVMLESYEPSLLRRGSTEHAHLLLEIMRRAQADRLYEVVDPDTYSVADHERQLSRLLDPTRWAQRCPIDPHAATPNRRVVADLTYNSEPEHTTHLAVIDEAGMAVSLTTTLSSGFGSKVITTSGIVLNNSLGSFSGLGRNQPLPNRRTTSSMAPTFVEDRLGLRLVLGTPGGDTIPSTLLQLINSLVDYGVPLDEAVDAPRLHQSIAIHADARLENRRPIASSLRRGLQRLGHRFTKGTGFMGHANSIALVGHESYGYADPREGGLALGISSE